MGGVGYFLNDQGRRANGIILLRSFVVVQKCCGADCCLAAQSSRRGRRRRQVQRHIPRQFPRGRRVVQDQVATRFHPRGRRRDGAVRNLVHLGSQPPQRRVGGRHALPQQQFGGTAGMALWRVAAAGAAPRRKQVIALAILVLEHLFHQFLRHPLHLFGAQVGIAEAVGRRLERIVVVAGVGLGSPGRLFKGLGTLPRRALEKASTTTTHATLVARRN